jgi:hypothetical protein
MVSRTNKMWILKKKAQQAKQKKIWWNKCSTLSTEKREYTNPMWNIYKWFGRTWKYICDMTTCREDPDWFRIVRKPNSWEIFWKENLESWGYKRRKKSNRKLK